MKYSIQPVCTEECCSLDLICPIKVPVLKALSSVVGPFKMWHLALRGRFQSWGLNTHEWERITARSGVTVHPSQSLPVSAPFGFSIMYDVSREHRPECSCWAVQTLQPSDCGPNKPVHELRTPGILFRRRQTAGDITQALAHSHCITLTSLPSGIQSPLVGA